MGLVRFVPTADIAPELYSLPELTIRWSVAPQVRDRYSKCPDEPNTIVAITSTETCKREVGVSKCIPTHLISQFFDEPFFA
jgi:hypothetical protein